MGYKEILLRQALAGTASAAFASVSVANHIGAAWPTPVYPLA